MTEEELTKLRDARKALTKSLEDSQKEQERELEKLREELRASRRDLREKTRKLEGEKESIEKELKNVKKQAQQAQTFERDLKSAQEKVRLLQRTNSTVSSGKVDDSAVNEILEEKAKVEAAKDKLATELSKLHDQLDDVKREKAAVEAGKKEIEVVPLLESSDSTG
jgi:chromosome segregation ATPase